jgi:hypothetical protein
MHRRQIELVEFSEKIYHSGLRHTGINGSLYEDILIKFLREDIPQFDFFKGQIKNDSNSSSQYDIMICKKGTPQNSYLKDVNHYINIIERKNCLGVIELKKWAYPKMLSRDGVIQSAYYSFKKDYPELRYFFVTLRFKDRKKNIEKTWSILKQELTIDGKFCFFGRTDPKDMEWKTPWNEEIIKKHEAYDGEYENLLKAIINIAPAEPNL